MSTSPSADVECPHFRISPSSPSSFALESRLENRRIGGEAAFHCPRGFEMEGESKLKCLRNGEYLLVHITWWVSITPLIMFRSLPKTIESNHQEIVRILITLGKNRLQFQGNSYNP